MGVKIHDTCFYIFLPVWVLHLKQNNCLGIKKKIWKQRKDLYQEFKDVRNPDTSFLSIFFPDRHSTILNLLFLILHLKMRKNI